MLRPRLIGAGGVGGAADPIEFIGGYARVQITTSVNLSMPSGTQVGDYAIVVDALAHTSDVRSNMTLGGNTSTMTEEVSLYQNDTYDMNFKLYHGVLTSTSNFSLDRSSTYFGSQGGGCVMIYRNVSGITNVQSQVQNNTNDPDIPTFSIGNSTNNWVGIAGASAHNGGTRNFSGSTVTSFSDEFIQAAGNSNRDCTVGQGYKSADIPATISGEQLVISSGTASYSSTGAAIFELVNG